MMMKVKKWLDKVSSVGPSEICDDDGEVYYSKFDGSYITRVGMEKNVEFLADREITEELTHGVGYSPKDNKWYGWSHRAIFGFEIGATCSKGDCHYFPTNEAEAIEAALRFWGSEDYHDLTAVKVREGVLLVSWTYGDKIPNNSLHGTAGSVESYYDAKFSGRGEWTAKTMEDAKRMATDFNEGVS
jgi:hypothetical protein